MFPASEHLDYLPLCSQTVLVVLLSKAHSVCWTKHLSISCIQCYPLHHPSHLHDDAAHLFVLYGCPDNGASCQWYGAVAPSSRRAPLRRCDRQVTRFNCTTMPAMVGNGIFLIIILLGCRKPGRYWCLCKGAFVARLCPYTACCSVKQAWSLHFLFRFSSSCDILSSLLISYQLTPIWKWNNTANGTLVNRSLQWMRQ